MLRTVHRMALAASILMATGCNPPAGRTTEGHPDSKSTGRQTPIGHGIDRDLSNKKSEKSAGNFDVDNCWALLIGVDKYARARDLNYCVKDIQALRSQLLSLGFSSSRVKVLRDDADVDHLPVRSNIEAELDALLGKLNASGSGLETPGMAEQGDMVLIALSGHGVHLSGCSYFCPADARFDKPEQTLVRIDRIYKRLEHCPARFKLVFIDACRNDPWSGDAKNMGKSTCTEKFAASLKVPKEAGTFVLASCSPGQISLEEPSFKHGVFMYFLLSGLGGAADSERGNRNGCISVFELFEYVNSKTKSWVYENKSGAAQTPTLFSPGEITEQFEFIRVPISNPIETPTATAAAHSKRGSSELPEYLIGCRLVFSVDTGAEVKLDAARKYVRNKMDDLIQFCTLQIDYANPAAMKPTVKGDWVCWELPVKLSPSKNPVNSTLWPEGMSLSVRIAVSRDGQFWLGTLGSKAQDHLMVMAKLAGMPNYTDFSGNYLPSSVYGVPHGLKIDTDEKQTFLSSIVHQLYSEFALQGLLSGGPANMAELYECPMRLRNFFEQPITIVCAMIHHEQFDYAWFSEDARASKEKANELWSPIASKPDQDANLMLCFAMRVTGDTRSALMLQAVCDNKNESSFRVCALSPDSSYAYHYSEGRWASIEMDSAANECRGRNQHCSGAVAVFYDEAPGRIELYATSYWSAVCPAFRYATFGKVRIRDCFISPEGSAKRKIQPQIWILQPE